MKSPKAGPLVRPTAPECKPTAMLVLLVQTMCDTVSETQKQAIMERWEHRLVQEKHVTLREFFDLDPITRGVETPG